MKECDCKLKDSCKDNMAYPGNCKDYLPIVRSLVPGENYLTFLQIDEILCEWVKRQDYIIAGGKWKINNQGEVEGLTLQIGKAG